MTETHLLRWEAMKGQGSADFHVAQRILSWTYFGYRPLSLVELRQALLADDSAGLAVRKMIPAQKIVSLCGGFVQSDPKTTLVHFTDESCRELLQAHQDLLPRGHARLARTCLAYLSSDAFATGPCPDQRAWEARHRAEPFLDYAVQYWGDHVRQAADASTSRQALDFLSLWTFEPHLGTLLQAQTLFSASGSAFITTLPPHSQSRLIVASSFGLKEAVVVMLQEGADVNAQSFHGEAALHAASRAGHAETVDTLLAAGADVNAQSLEGKTALQAASRASHVEIVDRLLAAGADVRTQSLRGKTALQAASRAGHVEIVDRLLAAGADVNAQSVDRDSALQAASQAGHSGIVRLLLQAGADVNARLLDLNTALTAASGAGHTAVVQLLLESGAEVNALTLQGETALQAASSTGHIDIVQLLLQAGADSDIP